MLIDGGVVTGYLAAALLASGKRWADRSLDGLLDRLTALVSSRMGRETVDRLAEAPQDEYRRQQTGWTIDGAMRADPALAAEITALVAELDRRGGQQFINQVKAQTNVQNFGAGIAAGRDVNYHKAHDPSDMSDAPGWVKLFVVLGTLLAVAGLGLFGYALFADQPGLDDPNFGEVPQGIPVAAGIFFAGFIILGIASLGRGLSRRR